MKQKNVIIQDMDVSKETKYNLNKTLLFINKISPKYDLENITLDYLNLYEDEKELKEILAFFHKNFDGLFKFMNHKFYPESGGHFNAGESRQLIELIDDFKIFKKVLKDDGINLILNKDYEEHINSSSVFLVKSGGSPIPKDYKKLELKEYDPIFTIGNNDIIKKNGDISLTLKTNVIGSGAFAIVSCYTDDFYERKFAVKKLRDTSDSRVISRFKQEFDILKKLDFPYILKVYKFFEKENKYIMEYCDTNLHDYIEKYNQKLSLDARKRIILQFLYAVNYLHSKNILHRDISFRNVLLQIYDNNVPIVKLSDFGLAKLPDSDFTKTETELKGTIVDFTLENLKDYNLKNEIYSIGHVVNYIISGKKTINNKVKHAYSDICDKCIKQIHEDRFGSVQEIIKEIEQLIL